MFCKYNMRENELTGGTNQNVYIVEYIKLN
jgi:hypothetical protein